MKKLLVLLLTILCLCGCQEIATENVDPDQRYFDMINTIKEHEVFINTSNYYDVSVEMAKIEEGYRYYVTIDNARIALYDIEAMAIEQDVDYSNTMAANIGIFEEKEYSMIPNQKNPEKGFVSGLVMSGVSELPETTLYIYVSFKNADYSEIKTEYFKLDVKYEGE